MLGILKDVFGKRPQKPSRTYQEVLGIAGRVMEIGNSCVNDAQRRTFEMWFYSNPEIDLEIQINARALSDIHQPDGYLSSVDFYHLELFPYFVSDEIPRKS